MKADGQKMNRFFLQRLMLVINKDNKPINIRRKTTAKGKPRVSRKF